MADTCRPNRMEAARLSRCWPRRGERILGIFALSVVALAALTLSTWATRSSRWLAGHIPNATRLDKNLNPFHTRHALYESGLPVYDIKIKPAKYRGILELIEKAKQRGQLTDDLKQWTKAKFIYNGTTRSVKIRPRGDMRNHWTNPQKSWRIRFPADAPFQSQQELNLIILCDSKGQTERFSNAVFRQLGLITLRDGYAILRINGVPQGVYYQVEHFTEAVLANHKRPVGAVFNGWHIGLELGAFEELITDGEERAWRALQTLLDYETDPVPENFERALAVTDVEDYLRFIAGTTLFCSDHTRFPSDNHRLYFDPSRGLFYRIPWDVTLESIPGMYFFESADYHSTFDIFRFHPMSQFRIALLTEPKYRLRRNRILWDLVKDDSLLDLWDETFAPLEFPLWLDVMSSEYEPRRLADNRATVAHNTAHIRNCLAGNRVEVRVRDEAPDVASMQIAVNNMSGVLLQQLRLTGCDADREYSFHRDDNHNGQLDSFDHRIGTVPADSEGIACFAGLSEMLLPEMDVARDRETYFTRNLVRIAIHPKTTRYDFLLAREPGPAAEHAMLPSIEVDFSNAVTDEKLSSKDIFVRAFHQGEDCLPTRRNVERTVFLNNNPGFIADPDDDQVVALPTGRHFITKTVVIPQRLTLRIEAGAELVMGAETSLVAYGPVKAHGRADAPIRIVSGSSRPWGALAIIRPGGPSVLRHVHVSGGSGATVDGITLTGAVAIHDGDVVIERSRFTDCPAQHALNVRNGTVNVRGSFFARNAGDAVALDYVSGTITRCHFADNLGNGLGISGAVVTVSGNRIERTSDAGIIIDEEACVTAVNNLLMYNRIGIAVTDLSVAHIDNCTFVSNPTCVAAHRNNPIFGGGEARIRECVLLDSTEPLTADTFSKIDVSTSVVPHRLKGTDCHVAAPGLVGRLRDRAFVMAGSPTGPANGTPGIFTAPIDLRERPVPDDQNQRSALPVGTSASSTNPDGRHRGGG